MIFLAIILLLVILFLMVKMPQKVVVYGIPVLYFAISLAFWLKTYDSAQIKITLIQIGGTLMLAAWLVKVADEDFWGFIKKNIVIIAPLLAFLVSGIVSYFHSPLKLASANELVRRIMYIGLALIVLKEFNSEDKFRRLFNWLLAAAALASIYGIIQFIDTRYFPPPPEPGLDPFMWRGAFNQRIFSTFGNPNFFGDFLVVMSPLTLAMYLKTRKFRLLLLWLMIAFCTIFTYSKGAWLGFGAGFVVFVLLTIGFFLKTKKAHLKTLLLGGTIAIVLLVGLGIHSNLKGRPDSASFRLFTWLSTWEMINTNPVIGTGIGTFYVTYPAWRRPQIFYIEGKHNTETDHPEDEYLEVWYDEGLIGAGIFFWLLAVFLTSGFRNLRAFSEEQNGKRDKRAYLQLAVLTAMTAQLVHNFVCVSLRFVSAGIFLWLMVGLIGALAVNNPLPEKEPALPEPSRLPKGARRVFKGAVLAATVYFVYIFAGYFDADTNHNIGIYFSKQQRWQDAIDYYSKVVDENPSFIMANYFLGNVYNDRWYPGDAERAIEKYQEVWKLAPNYVQSHYQAGLIYMKAGDDEKRLADEARQKGNVVELKAHEQKKMAYWNKALEQFERYRMIDPIYPQNYYLMARIYNELGQVDKAEESYLAHLRYPETLAKAPHNAWVEDWKVRRPDDNAETCWNLGNLRMMKNDLKGAEDYYLQSLKWNPKMTNSMKNLSMIYARQGKMKEYNDLWQQIRMIAPDDPDVKRVFNLQPAAQR